ncbi:MAG: hypothetical protein L6R39_003555 [Caloplaca ligustica]|nr:MAG: hypothetical protein L6R39_003555 [Caloplaca ligustica]
MQSGSPKSALGEKDHSFLTRSSTSPTTMLRDGRATYRTGMRETDAKILHGGLDDNDGIPPQRPSKNTPGFRPGPSPSNEESYFNIPRGSSSSTSSIVSLSKITLAAQLSQLASLQLPDANSFSKGVSSIPAAATAAKAAGNAADKMRVWLQKANDILTAMDADDDVEWAAAAGREGLEDIEKAIGRFEGLVHLYVKAIENLQERTDIADVPTQELEALVEQMEVVLGSWNKVRSHLKTVKSQVELAMEYKELWNVVLADITREVDSLKLLIFEMEEKRHMSPSPEEMLDEPAMDVKELETIVEEAPTNAQIKANQRFSLPAAFSANSPMTSPSFAKAQDDSNLMALFARMQPLRASLDFLPMTLSSFRSRAEPTMPTACNDLEHRRKALEKKWKVLEKDAELLRRELSEDRWVLVFRNAGRQAEKLCESVERSISKLRESIDAGAHHVSPATLAKKVESYEAKKMHYGPAVERVLAIIEKGVKDRQTINGEVLRLHLDSRARWTSLETQMKELDQALEEVNTCKNQQLRDSISTIVSMDRSAPGSTDDTPGSSPASSVAGTPNGKLDASSPAVNGASRRGSLVSHHPTSRSSSTRRMFTAPGASALSQMPRKAPATRSMSSDSWSMSRGASPSPYSGRVSSTPTPSGRRPSLALSMDGKPRWNSSPRVDYNDFKPHSKPPGYLTPPTGRKSSLSFRSPSSAASPYASGLPLPSPLGRSDTSSPVPRSAPPPLPHRPRLPSGVQTELGHRQPSTPTTPLRNPTSKLNRQTSASHVPSSRRESLNPASPYPPLPSSAESASIAEEPAVLGSSPEQPSPSKRAAAKTARPSTAMASSRRISMLPQPKKSVSPLVNGGAGRESALGRR